MARWVNYEVAYADLESRDPGERLLVLLGEFAAGGLLLTPDEYRELFIFAWADGANNAADVDHDTLRMLRWLAPVRDAETYLSGTLTIYRPADAGDRSIRWTLDESVARREGNGVVRGSVQASDVLAHLVGEGTNRTLVDPDDVSDVAPF